MEYSELQGICVKAIKYGLCLGCQQLENPYFKGKNKCQYVKENHGEQVRLNLDGGKR
jgi:hypothetical protein|nr:MAG TPA: hypothetical protein [Caudoviricetes sp.]